MSEFGSNQPERSANYPAFSMEDGLSLEKLPVAGNILREIRKALGYTDGEVK